MERNLSALWANLSRACEIALLGQFTVQVTFDKDYVQGFDDYKQIKAFFKGVEFVKDGDLIVEVFKPDYRMKDRRCESWQAVEERVKQCKSFPLPDAVFCNSGQSLFNTAIERLCLSLSQQAKVLAIAQVIAQSAGCKSIKPEHVAEAIQYQIMEAGHCNAEIRSIHFGKGIEIALHELDNTDVENCIDYLKNLIA